MRVYDLRHSCATLLLLAGVSPKVVAERLGHASVVLTLNTYSHVLGGMQEQAAAKLGAALFGLVLIDQTLVPIELARVAT